MSLATKYRPSRFEDMVEQKTIVNIVDSLCQKEDLENRNFLFIGPAGCGKAQPLWSKVLTPSGFVNMGDIHEGDEVITHTGCVGTVTGIFPQGVRPIYKMTLSDGTSIDVADNHLNLVTDRLIQKDLVVTTDYLLHHYTRTTYDVPYANLVNWSSLWDAEFLVRSNLDIELPTRSICEIRLIGHDECRCIYVDHPDHTYISDCYIPTHNTTTARIMANVLNDGKGEPIEIDAASHNGVDSVREIVNQARMYPVGSKYKVFVIDECFPGDVRISIPDGFKYLRDVEIGDTILAKDGPRKVTNKFTNRVPTSRLICLHISNATRIITTLDHKFYSDGQWIEAQNLVRGISLYTSEVSPYIQEGPVSRCMLVFSEKYIPGKNDDVFLGSISREDLDSGFVTFYDLEVEEEHCYFVNGVLVHNCHSFSQQAWQIFLKPLEDAPAKSIFIFCTTNPEKIPATIISRVQTFQLSKISLKGIYNRLVYILEQENKEGAGITYTEDAVNYIAKLANGGLRDSITTLDKTLAFTHDLTSESVSQALGLPEYDDYFKLLGAYSKRDNKVVSEVINDVYNSGVNFVKWFEGFHSFVMNVVKYIFLQDINLTMIPSHYQEKIAKYGTPHSIVCLKLANKLLKLNYELKTTQYLQEVALTYLCQLPKQ